MGKAAYLMIVNKDLNNSYQFTIELKEDGRKLIRICNYSGRKRNSAARWTGSLPVPASSFVISEMPGCWALRRQ